MSERNDDGTRIGRRVPIVKRSRIIAIAAVTVLLGALILAVAPAASPWGGWKPATCLPDHCFCEAIRNQLVKQPSNSISGLAFVAVALLVLLAQRTRINRQARVYATLYACASAIVGLGTVFYHASFTFWGQTADVLGMYLIVTLLVMYSAVRLRALEPARAAFIYIVGNAALLTGLILVPGARRHVFAALVVVAITLELDARRKGPRASNPRLFLAAIAVLAAGFAIWSLDITRAVCAPASWLQGHAVWHVATACSAWLVFLYYDERA